MGFYWLSPGDAPMELLVGGDVTNHGPDTIYYSDTEDVTPSTYEVALAPTEATVLDGAWWFATFGSRCLLEADPSVLPEGPPGPPGPPGLEPATSVTILTIPTIAAGDTWRSGAQSGLPTYLFDQTWTALILASQDGTLSIETSADAVTWTAATTAVTTAGTTTVFVTGSDVYFRVVFVCGASPQTAAATVSLTIALDA